MGATSLFPLSLGFFFPTPTRGQWSQANGEPSAAAGPVGCCMGSEARQYPGRSGVLPVSK